MIPGRRLEHDGPGAHARLWLVSQLRGGAIAVVGAIVIGYVLLEAFGFI